MKCLHPYATGVVGMPGYILALALMISIPGYAAVDFTKPYDPNDDGKLYNVGPTGLLGMYNNASHSHQIRVRQVAEGSPAEGKLLPGDVITGVNGKPFTPGENIIEVLGNIIDEAEKKENGGKISFSIWRDANFRNRASLRKSNIDKIDVTEFIEVIEADDSADLDRYKSEKAIAAQIQGEWKAAYEKFPIQESEHVVTLTLKVMPSYSDTSPFDCPKIKMIREQAYPYLEKELNKDFIGWNKHMVPLALLASGKPEHVEMVKSTMKEHQYNIRPHGRTWMNGYNITFVGEYYHRTGDKDALPVLARLAHKAAQWESHGGTWGHGTATAYRRWVDPYGPFISAECSGNYGEMNQAGGPCFYGMALAQKAGIKDPLVDDGISRAIRFNTSWVDKGGAPYGFHGPVVKKSNSNNGKNGPPGLAFHVLGQEYKAQYFGLYGAVEASVGYTSGHGDGTFGRLWPQLLSSVAGDKAVQMWMRKMRPYYTMSRQHDGTFVQPSSGMGLGIGSLFDPTAMAVLHYSIPLKKLYMTGRDVAPEMQANEKDLQHLKEKMEGIKFEALSDQQILNRLDTFDVLSRREYEKELAKRHREGRSDIVPEVMKLVDHSNSRVREAALKIVTQCGGESLNKSLPVMAKSLQDPAEIVRRAAVHGIKEYVTGGGKTQSDGGLRIKPYLEPLLEAATTVFPDRSSDTDNTLQALSSLMLNTDNPFSRDPFGQGLDPHKVRYALERFFQLDPRYDVMKGPINNWDRGTCMQIAGPLLYLATEKDMNGKMFGGQAIKPARALLAKNQFIEVAEAGLDKAYVVPRFPDDVRGRGMMRNIVISGPEGLGRSALPWLKLLSLDDPTAFPAVIRHIADHEPPPGWISLEEYAMALFYKEADAAGGRDAQIEYCRNELNPESISWFRQKAAMSRLAALSGPEAIRYLAPFLVHDNWRVNDHCRTLIREMKDPRTGEVLASLTTGDHPGIAAAALVLLGERGDSIGLSAGTSLISSHKDVRVRAAAAQAVYGGSQGKELGKLLTLMKGLEAPEEINGYYQALRMGLNDPAQGRVIVATLRKYMDIYPKPIQKKFYKILALLGGADNLAYLKNRLGPEHLNYVRGKLPDESDVQEFEDILTAISMSPDPAATQMLLDILSEHKGTERTKIISKCSVIRLVNGAGDIGTVSNEANLDFAEAHLKIYRNTSILQYLENIPERRSIDILLQYMKLGPADVTETCAKSIDVAASRMSTSMPIEDRKVVANALREVLEYIQVVHFKGSRDVPERKEKWKEVSDSAGHNLKRIFNPEDMILTVPGPAPSPGKGPAIGPGPAFGAEEDIDI